MLPRPTTCKKTIILLIVLSVLSFLCTTHSLFANEYKISTELTSLPPSKGKIAIIIDDLGHKKSQGEEVLDLGIPLAVAVLPKTRHGEYLANLASTKDAEVMLHLPMQPSFNPKLMTPHTLSIDMDKQQLTNLIEGFLTEIPHVKGVNNHMGSLFTQLPEQMGWLMESIHAHGNKQGQNLFFVDSYTSERSIAYEVARQFSIPSIKRDVFLDRELDPEHMQEQIDKVERLAAKHGQVVVIGHPFDETIALLRKHIPELKKQGYEFVKVSSLTRHAVAQGNQDKKVRINDSFQTIH